MTEPTKHPERQTTHFVANTQGARYEVERPDPASSVAFAARNGGVDSSTAPRHPRSTRVGRIVVGVDGSESGRQALDRAVIIANALDTNLELVTTWRLESGYAFFGSPHFTPETDARQTVADAASATFGGVLPDWVSIEARAGNAATVLVEASKGANMLIVGCRGHGGMTGLFLGSISSACAERAECPVLIVH